APKKKEPGVLRERRIEAKNPARSNIRTQRYSTRRADPRCSTSWPTNGRRGSSLATRATRESGDGAALPGCRRSPGARMKQMAQKTRASQPSSKTPGKNNDRREHWSVGERQTTGADRGHSSAECGYPARVLVR